MAIKRIEKNDLVAKGALDNLTQGAKEAKASVDLLKKALEAVVTLSKEVKSKIPKTGGSPTTVKGQNELNKQTQRANQLAKNKLTINKQLLKEQERLKQQTSARNKLLKEEVALEKTQIGSLNRLRAESKKLVKERNNLNITTTKGAKRLKEINKQLDKNNKVIQKNASALGKQKINIGNYGSALGKLRGALGQLGLAFGVFAILRKSFNVVRDFGQAQANLASVLGVTTEQMSKLTEQSKELGATTTFTASQVSELQKEYAKLGFTQKEIENVTEATLLLAEATGTDLARSAEVTGSTLRAFGLDSTETQRVVDVMAKSFSSSSLDMEKFAVAMRAVAPVAKTAGLNIEQTTALLGTLTDRGLDASTAGTSLRNVFLELSKSGMTFEEAMAEINASTDKNKTALELFGKRGATTGVILSETAGDVANLTEKLLDSEESAKKMAETQRNTLGGSLKLLQSAFEGFILKMDEAGGVGEKLRKGIKFLADNFESILSTLGRVVKALITFKIAMKAIRFSQSIGGLKGLVAGFKSIGTSAKTASVSARALGTAIKSISLAGLLVVFVEFASALWDVASGAQRARFEVDELNKATGRGRTFAEENLKKLREKVQLQINEIELTKKSREEKDKEIKAVKQNANEALKTQKKLVDERIKELFREKREQQKIVDKAQSNVGVGLVDQFGKSFVGNAVERAIALGNEQNNLLLIRNELKSLLEVQTLYNDEIGVFNQELVNIEIGLNNEGVVSEEVTVNLEKQLEVLTSIFRRKKEINGVKLVDIGRINFPNITDSNKERLTRNVLEAEYNILLAEGVKSEEELNELRKKKILAQAELDKLGKSLAEQQVIDLKAQKAINNLIIDNEVDKYDIIKQSIETTTQLFIKSADERISKINEEIDAEKKKADLFRGLAESGNISAKESLAQQNKIIAEANAKREREEKRKQRILLASSVLQSYNSNLANGDTNTEALTKALTSTTLITQFINALPAFLEGTENTSKSGAGQNIDGKGGFHAVLHQNERVLTSKQNDMIGNYSNDEVASIMEKHRLGKLMPDSQIMLGFGSHEMVNKLMNVESKLDQVTKAIQDKPVPNIELGEITQSYMILNKRVESTKGTTTSKFKVK